MNSPQHAFAKLLRIVALLIIAALALPAQAEPVVHRASGIVFPDEVASFTRTGMADYESQRAGLGFSYTYKNTSAGLTATVYVYTAGVSPVPSRVDDPVMVQLREQTIREIEGFARSRNEVAQHNFKTVSKVSSDSGEVAVLFDSFIISSSSGTRNTFLWLWSSRGHFLKIRITRDPTGTVDPKPMGEFSEAIVRLAAPQKDAKRHINVSLVPSSSPEETAIRMAYGVSLGNWVNKNQLASTAPEGPFVPTFEAELYARQTQLQVWKELREKGTPSLPYMEEMQRVEDAGHLREYIWHHHRQSGWGAPPIELKMEAFSLWSTENLREHVPQTGAQVVFGPLVAK